MIEVLIVVMILLLIMMKEACEDHKLFEKRKNELVDAGVPEDVASVAALDEMLG